MKSYYKTPEQKKEEALIKEADMLLKEHGVCPKYPVGSKSASKRGWAPKFKIAKAHKNLY